MTDEEYLKNLNECIEYNRKRIAKAEQNIAHYEELKREYAVAKINEKLDSEDLLRRVEEEGGGV